MKLSNNRARAGHIALLFMAFSMASAPAAFAQASAAPPLGTVLEDQFGNSVDVGRAMRSGRTILAVSDEREAGDRLAEWAARLRPDAPAGVVVLYVADLSAVPFFVPKSAIVKQLREDYPGLAIMLDWKGVVAKAVSLGKLKNVAEAWSGGRRVARVEGKTDAEKVLILFAPFR